MSEDEVTSDAKAHKGNKLSKARLHSFASRLVKYPVLWTNTHEFVPQKSWSDPCVVEAAEKLCQWLQKPCDLNLVKTLYYHFKVSYVEILEELVLNKIAEQAPLSGMQLALQVLKTASPWVKYVERKYSMLNTVIQQMFEDTDTHSKRNRLKRLLIRKMETCLCATSGLREFAADLDVPENLLTEAWDQMCTVARYKLQLVLHAGDWPPPRAALSACMTALDWRVADLLVLNGQFRLLDEGTMVSTESQRPLTALLRLTAHCQLEARPPPARDELRRRWNRAHHIYNRHGPCASLVMLQRRWYELKAASRERLLAVCHRIANAPTPMPIHVVIAKRYPHVVTEPLPSWQELVESGAIFKPFDHDAAVSDGDQQIEDDDNDDFHNSISFGEELEIINSDSHGAYNGVLVIEDSSCDDPEPKRREHSASSNKEGTSLQSQGLDTGQENNVLDILGRIDPKTVQTVVVFSSESENDDDQDSYSEPYGNSDRNEISNDISEAVSKACSEYSENNGRSSANSEDSDISDHEGQSERSNDIDSKLLMKPVVVLEKLPDGLLPTTHLYSLKSLIKSYNTKEIVTNPFQCNQSKSIHLDHSYSSNSRKRTYSPNLRMTHPDFNPELLKLSPEFLSSDNVQRLLGCCKPVTVDIERLLIPMMLKETTGYSGRVTKKVELPDIEEIRRINKNILTAEVAPISITAKKSMIVLDASCSDPSTGGSSSTIDSGSELSPPTEHQLQEALERLKAKWVRWYCCLARRERVRLEARRRLAARAGRIYRTTVTHEHRGKECKCCCAHLMAGDAPPLQHVELAQRALFSCLRAILRALDRRGRRILANDKNFNKVKPHLAGVKKEKAIESRKRKRVCMNKHEETQSSEMEHVNEYEEWIRQRNIGSILYGLKPLEVKIYHKTPIKLSANASDSTAAQIILNDQQQAADTTANTTSEKRQKPEVLANYEHKHLNTNYFGKVAKVMAEFIPIQFDSSTKRVDVLANETGVSIKQAGVSMKQAGVSTKQAGVLTKQAGESSNQAGMSMNQADASGNRGAKRFIVPIRQRPLASKVSFLMKPSTTDENNTSVKKDVDQINTTMNDETVPMIPGVVNCTPIVTQVPGRIQTSASAAQPGNETARTGHYTHVLSSHISDQMITKLASVNQTTVSIIPATECALNKPKQHRVTVNQVNPVFTMFKQNQQIFDPVVKSIPTIKRPIVTLMPTSNNQLCQQIEAKANSVNVHTMLNLIAGKDASALATETNQKQQPTSNVEKPAQNIFNSAVVSKIRNVIKDASEGPPMPIITSVCSQYDTVDTAEWLQQQPSVSEPESTPLCFQPITEEPPTETFIPVISDVTSFVDTESSDKVSPNVGSVVSNEIIELSESDDESPAQMNFKQMSEVRSVHVKDFIRGCDINNVTLICLSAMETPFLLQGNFLILTNRYINITKPVYWSVGPRNLSNRIIFNDSESNEIKRPSGESYLSAKQINNSTLQNENNLSQSRNILSQNEINSFLSGNNSSQIDTKSYQSGNKTQSESNTSKSGENSFQDYKPRLKVKSFAKMTEENSMNLMVAIPNNTDDVTSQTTSEAGNYTAPDIIVMQGLAYKKLVDVPVLSYAKVLSAMNLKQSHDCLVSGHDVYFYSLETGVISPLLRTPIVDSNTNVASGTSRSVLNDLLTGAPTGVPTGAPIGIPTGAPIGVPTGVPIGIPTGAPIGVTTGAPIGVPTDVPYGVPTGVPIGVPTDVPYGVPTGVPIGVPTDVPYGVPTGVPIGVPTGAPIGLPTYVPCGVPTGVPIGVRTDASIGIPTGAPIGVPTGVPIGIPAGVPTDAPTGVSNANSGNITSRFRRVSLSTNTVAMQALHDLMSKLIAFQIRATD